MDIDINSQPGPGRADKNVASKNQADSATEILISNSESMKVVQDKLKKIINRLVELERRLSLQECIENLLEASIKVKSEKWYNIFKQIIYVTLFLGERGIAFQGSSQRIGNSNNVNLLGLIVSFPLGPHSKGTCAKGRLLKEKG